MDKLGNRRTTNDGRIKTTLAVLNQPTRTPMPYNLTDQQFVEQFQNADFVLRTQSQIAKDFERSGFLIELSENTPLSLEELSIVVAKTLAEVMQSGETITLQLLYQIDIPQEQFLALTTDPDFLSKASELIIRREAQKVYLRSIFS
ncbi:MAG: hypothetical protein NXI10_08195 [bacterium]|nr:hypothetical protein [bacterium]